MIRDQLDFSEFVRNAPLLHHCQNLRDLVFSHNLLPFFPGEDLHIVQIDDVAKEAFQGIKCQAQVHVSSQGT
jgi:hypothetical protein